MLRILQQQCQSDGEPYLANRALWRHWESFVANGDDDPTVDRFHADRLHEFLGGWPDDIRVVVCYEPGDADQTALSEDSRTQMGPEVIESSSRLWSSFNRCREKGRRNRQHTEHAAESYSPPSSHANHFIPACVCLSPFFEAVSGFRTRQETYWWFGSVVNEWTVHAFAAEWTRSLVGLTSDRKNACLLSR